MPKDVIIKHFATCNVCNTRFVDPFTGLKVFSDEEILDNYLENAGWYVYKNTTICPKCLANQEQLTQAMKKF